MNRAEALAYLNETVDVVMTAAGRLTTDVAGGYKPALDRAFRLYITANSLDTTVTTTDTADVDDECFTALLEAVVYDLTMPNLAANNADISVDAPLTSIKHSQKFRQWIAARSIAWERAGACGYVSHLDNVNAYRINLDFREPADTTGAEWG